MKFLDFLDLIISGAFALAAFLYYLAHKDNIKTLKEKWDTKGMHLWSSKIKAFIIIFFLIVASLVYFFSFIKVLKIIVSRELL